VYVGSSDGRLYVLDLATGEKRWEFDTGSALTASPAIAGGRVVIGSQDGVLYCFG
jgi:outer membrane protein assembly factor BamB